MHSFSLRLLGLAWVFLLLLGALAPHLSADLIKTFNTGVDSGSALLAPGTLDPTYTLIESADPAFPGPNLFVLDPVGGPNEFPIGFWFPNGPTSQWLVPYANGVTSVETASPQGRYVYRTTFDLTGFVDSGARIDGLWAVDENGIDIILNGVSTGLTTASPGFSAFTPFSLTTGFVPGFNTVDFVTTNINQSTGNPIGLRVEGTVTATPPQNVHLAWDSDLPGTYITTLSVFGKHWSIFYYVSSTSHVQVDIGYRQQIEDMVKKIFLDSGITINFAPDFNAPTVYFVNALVDAPELFGETFTGVDQFNERPNDQIAVFLRDAYASTPQDYAEIVAHELGHGFGLRHVHPDLPEIMDDDDFALDGAKIFNNGPFPLSDRASVGGHNPQYHLKRYVAKTAHQTLVDQGILPGSWDQSLRERLQTRIGSDSDLTLFDVMCLSDGHSYSGSGSAKLIAHFDSITLRDLAQINFTFDSGDLLSLIASSSPGGPKDIVVASGNPFTPENVSLPVTPGATPAFVQIQSNTPDGYTTLENVTINSVVVIPLQLDAAVSRKIHGGAGTFDIDLPLTGESGVECRNTDSNLTLVFSFTDSVVSGSASVTAGTGSVFGSPTFSGNTMTVNLTGVADLQRVTVTLSGVTDEFSQVLSDTSVSVNMLIGDTNGDKTVDRSDILQAKAQLRIPVTGANFREDVDVSGSIRTKDVGIVKSHRGASLP